FPQEARSCFRYIECRTHVVVTAREIHILRRHSAAADRPWGRLRPAPESLLRHHDFLKLWSAQTVSQLGTQVTNFALPMVAILWLHASALQVGALATLQLLPFALIGL